MGGIVYFVYFGVLSAFSIVLIAVGRARVRIFKKILHLIGIAMTFAAAVSHNTKNLVFNVSLTGWGRTTRSYVIGISPPKVPAQHVIGLKWSFIAAVLHPLHLPIV